MLLSPNFHRLKLILFTGKGGVGKTTLSCGFARALAKQFPTEKILLVSTDPAHSLGDILQLSVGSDAEMMPDIPNLYVQAFDAELLLKEFKGKYGKILETLVERGSFVEGEDLTPAWDMSWPGLDELMGLLEIQRLFTENLFDRVIVDMAPTGHALNLLGLMDFLDNLLVALELFQEKHRVISRSFVGRYNPDDSDAWLDKMKQDLTAGRSLIQDQNHTACLVVAIAEAMSYFESQRLVEQLQILKIASQGFFVNRILSDKSLNSMSVRNLHRYGEQQLILEKFTSIAGEMPVFIVPELTKEPLGVNALDDLISQIVPYSPSSLPLTLPSLEIFLPEKVLPSFNDFITEKRRLIIVGGKGGVGKTTVAAAIGWAMAEKYPDKQIRIISIDPAHSLGDAFAVKLGHEPSLITQNLSAQEVDSEIILNQFREDYLLELAEMMSGDSGDENSAIKLAYGPQAWRQIVSQALPGMDEMLSVVEVMRLLEKNEIDLIILDTAPTGHLLRFLEMPAAMSDWLAWIFKLWIKYQDVLGRVDFMSRLRSLRTSIVQAQKKLKDGEYTEFIGVVQAEAAIFAEQARLSESLEKMGVEQRFVVHNRYDGNVEIDGSLLAGKTVVRLPVLPRSVEAMRLIEMASNLLF
ncbi:TRC40/GET3/ArsA family transport-energizing ATPase [Ancylothrix sp. C2]|uniref:ArsA family ATPase n=1 Tax=Ancylothrix sp. D3o TaxID=2953691 RepID=UPI0021BA8403|nr:ArsA family ATPase [Ancylothrix sp. D3o]MCT7950627.1 TRC40/GET3/ArsA family transport-energizing ATPase [Ancylothrix sp. D3o]